MGFTLRRVWIASHDDQEEQPPVQTCTNLNHSKQKTSMPETEFQWLQTYYVIFFLPYDQPCPLGNREAVWEMLHRRPSHLDSPPSKTSWTVTSRQAALSMLSAL
jgi:hypothetical protein